MAPEEPQSPGDVFAQHVAQPPGFVLPASPDGAYPPPPVAAPASARRKSGLLILGAVIAVLAIAGAAVYYIVNRASGTTKTYAGS